MRTVGDQFPAFRLTAVTPEIADAFIEISNEDLAGAWSVVFFWPMDFTFVCPTEITQFGRLHEDFAKRDTKVLGVSIDSEYAHLAWRQQHPGLRDLPLPMLADVKRELAGELGILDHGTGTALRATFIVDPENVIRFVQVNDMNVGRSAAEVLRVLDALQTGELTPCEWQQGAETLGAA